MPVLINKGRQGLAGLRDGYPNSDSTGMASAAKAAITDPEVMAALQPYIPSWVMQQGVPVDQYITAALANPQDPASGPIREILSGLVAPQGTPQGSDMMGGGPGVPNTRMWDPTSGGQRRAPAPPPPPAPPGGNQQGLLPPPLQPYQGQPRSRTPMPQPPGNFPQSASMSQPNKAGLDPLGGPPQGNKPTIQQPPPAGGPPPPPGGPQVRDIPQGTLKPGDPGYWAQGLDRNGPPPVHGVLQDLANDPAVHAHLESIFGPSKLPAWAQEAGMSVPLFILSVGNRPVGPGFSSWLLNMANQRLTEAGFGTVADWSESVDFPAPPGGDPPPQDEPAPDSSMRPAAPDWREQQLLPEYRRMLEADPNANIPDWARQMLGQNQSTGAPRHPSMQNLPAGVTPPQGAEAYRLGPNGEHQFRVRGQGGAVWITVQPTQTGGGTTTETPPTAPPPPPGDKKPFLGGRQPSPPYTRPDPSFPVGGTGKPTTDTPPPQSPGGQASFSAPSPPFNPNGPPNDLPPSSLESRAMTQTPPINPGKREFPGDRKPVEPGTGVYSQLPRPPRPPQPPTTKKNYRSKIFG